MQSLRLVALNGLLLAVIAAVIGAVQVLDRHSAPIEASIRRYAAAVQAQDLERALAELTPDRRAAWTNWVEGQLGNLYDVRTISIHAPSLLERLGGGVPTEPDEATVVMDVNRGYPDFFYQPTIRVPLARVDGRWYLDAPLLAPSEE